MRLPRAVLQAAVIAVLGACLTEAALRVYHHFVPVFLFPGERLRRFRGQPHGRDYDFRLNSGGFRRKRDRPRVFFLLRDFDPVS